MTEVNESLIAAEAEAGAGKTAPRVSLDDIVNSIRAQYFFNAANIALSSGQPDDEALQVLTICIVVMDNGFTVVGISAPASPENFDEDLGRKLAYEHCVRQLWPLMGFALRDRLANVPPEFNMHNG